MATIKFQFLEVVFLTTIATTTCFTVARAVLRYLGPRKPGYRQGRHVFQPTQKIT